MTALTVPTTPSGSSPRVIRRTPSTFEELFETDFEVEDLEPLSEEAKSWSKIAPLVTLYTTFLPGYQRLEACMIKRRDESVPTILLVVKPGFDDENCYHVADNIAKTAAEHYEKWRVQVATVALYPDQKENPSI